jgi:hypothetical protein
MKKIYSLPLLLICFLFVFAQSTLAAYFTLSPSTGTISGTKQVQLNIDAEEVSLDSAQAIVTFDSTKVEVTNITNGTFFDNVTTDTTVAGEITINGTLDVGDTDGVTSTGIIATLTISPKVSTGTIALNIDCDATASDTSQILNTLGSDVIVCSKVVDASYSFASDGSTITSTPSATTDPNQPSLPEELPQSGPRDWLKWITSGMALIGIGLLLL